MSWTTLVAVGCLGLAVGMQQVTLGQMQETTQLLQARLDLIAQRRDRPQAQTAAGQPAQLAEPPAIVLGLGREGFAVAPRPPHDPQCQVQRQEPGEPPAVVQGDVETVRTVTNHLMCTTTGTLTAEHAVARVGSLRQP